ncbi:hypothetical protein FRY74_00835 [Vicingus serpentipes]|uniref:DUF4064 domain-containing protein n=1 Tax=Vicingus serpentipes TaxID=1926625 RepID=A0A5C6RWT3_9FLAO|nr:hypothetical protein [Vicingus serpentipes]TXB66761.1 hypothetical protein FRY74_00835 [Vicingus serpentipes]
MTEESTQVTSEAGKRPVFLTVICILSFIAAGFAIIGYVTALTVMGAAGAAMSAMEGMEGMEGMEALTSAAPSAGMTWAYIIVGFLTTLVSLFGVIKMWKLNKQGFMLYAGASVVSMIMGIIYSGFGVMGLIVPVAFIVMYYLNLKHMH